MSVEMKIVKELPKIAGRGRESEYDDILRRFLDKEEARFAEISKEGKGYSSIVSSLRNRIKKLEIEDKVQVKTINKKVYLVKK